MCNHCNESIEEIEYVTALGKSWHNGHFVCSGCGDTFENSFFPHLDRAFCGDCFRLNFGEKCSLCRKLLDESFVLDEGEFKVHPECIGFYHLLFVWV